MTATASLTQPSQAEREGIERCQASIAKHSKSFALAARLFPPTTADRAAIVYAWCRRADDAIDASPRAEQPAALARLRVELDAVYAGDSQCDPELRSFQAVVDACGIPRDYPEGLLAGMAMDRDGQRYADRATLLTYCFRVAGTVGLMMCHVMGVSEPCALRRAAHLGIAMQLTNICRDVLEDWELGRLYLPDDLLTECGVPGLADRLGEPFPRAAREGVARAVRQLLAEADDYYRSGDSGLSALSWRCALAVRAARLIYAAIGRRVERQDCDVTRGRAIVPWSQKLRLIAQALARAALELPGRTAARLAPRRSAPRFATTAIRFPEDVLPV